MSADRLSRRAPYGATQRAIEQWLRDNGPGYVHEIAADLSHAPQTIRTTLNRLLRQGVVRRRDDLADTGGRRGHPRHCWELNPRPDVAKLSEGARKVRAGGDTRPSGSLPPAVGGTPQIGKLQQRADRQAGPALVRFGAGPAADTGE